MNLFIAILLSLTFLSSNDSFAQTVTNTNNPSPSLQDNTKELVNTIDDSFILPEDEEDEEEAESEGLDHLQVSQEEEGEEEEKDDI